MSKLRLSCACAEADGLLSAVTSWMEDESLSKHLGCGEGIPPSGGMNFTLGFSTSSSPSSSSSAGGEDQVLRVALDGVEPLVSKLISLSAAI